MNTWAPHLYSAEGVRKGISPEVIETSLKIANSQISRGFPPILSLGHLSFHTGVSFKILRSYVSRKCDPYRHFSIKKKSGGKRHICVPEDNLLRVQRWIDRNVLSAAQPSSSSYAYHRGRTIYECAQQHCGCIWMIKIDMSHFFESLSEIQAYRVFLEIGYSQLVSFELARICTRVYPHFLIEKDMIRRYRQKCWINNKEVDLKMRIKEYNFKEIGHLPQGAPTSPKLSNLIVKSLDEKLIKLAADSKLTYTRYADDMLFSTADKRFDKAQARAFIKAAFRILPAHGLRPNLQKTNILSPGARKLMLGTLVDTEKPRLTKVFKRRLECHLHYIKKDPMQHAERRGFNSIFGLKNYVIGLISYANQIDKEYTDKIMKEYAPINWPI